MKLYSFEIDGRPILGAERGDQLVDLDTDLLSLIGGGEAALDQARRVLEAGQRVYRRDEVRILAPLRPAKMLCSGVNYRSHQDEVPGAVLPETPGFFSKLPNTVIGPGEPIRLPRMSSQVDYEVELAVVIGRRLYQASEDEASSGVFGYTILHDVSARDVQFKAPQHNQITLGKNFDSFCPLGPCVVTADELRTPETCRLRTYLNGELMQDASNDGWLFPLPYLLAFLSQVMTLEPGDIVTTGTPGGVGVFRQPQIFLKPGDVVALEIDGIGRLENPVVAAEPIT